MTLRRDSLDRLFYDIYEGRISRRELIKRGAALGLSASAVATLLAACGGDDETPAPTTAGGGTTGGGAAPTATRPAGAAASPAASPGSILNVPGGGAGAGTPSTAMSQGVPGGTLTIAFPSAPLRLDPATAGSGDEYMLTQALYDNLVRIDEKLNLQPQLATSWQVASDGLSWTFKLQSGVKFHHGKDFKAEDAVFSISRVLDPATASSGRSAFSVIDKMETPDDLTIVFRLKFPYADFPYVLGSTFGRIVPSDRSAEQIGKDPVGTGPFKMETYEPGSRIVLAKNTSYWVPGLPYLDKVVQLRIAEQTAAAAALKANQVQVFWNVGPSAVPSVSGDPNIEVIEIPSPSFQPLVMRTDTPPWDNVKARQALMYTLDRRGIVQAVLQGKGTVSNDNTVPTISPFFKETPLKNRDIAKAKQLLAEAGHPNGIDLELVASSERAGLVEQATIVKQLAAEAGFRINIKTVPWDVFVAQYNDKHPFYINNWFGRPTIDETLYPYYHSTGSWNDYEYKNPKVDELLDAGRKESDLAKRKEIYGQLQDIMTTEGPAGIAYHSSFINALQKSVKNYIIHPIRWVDVRWTYLQR